IREPDFETPPPRRGSSRKAFVWVIVIFALIVLGAVGLRSLSKSHSEQAQAQGRGGGGRRGGGADANRPVPVSAAPAQQRDVPVYFEGLGNVQAYYTVTIHSRVDGELMQVNFREGQQV